MAVPRDLAERVAAAADVSEDARRLESITRRLLRQPGAARVRHWLWAVLVWGTALWIAAAALLGHAWRLEYLDRTGVLLLIAAPIISIVAVSWIVRARFVGRQALRVMTLDFAARPPVRPGAGHCCRACGAPLPQNADRIVVRCI